MAAEIKIRVWKYKEDKTLFTVARKIEKASRDMISIKILLSNESRSTGIVTDERWNHGWMPNVSEKDSDNTSNIKKIIISKSIFEPEHKLYGDL